MQEPRTSPNAQIGCVWELAGLGRFGPDMGSCYLASEFGDRDGGLVAVLRPHDSDLSRRRQMPDKQVHQPTLAGEIRQFGCKVENLEHRVERDDTGPVNWTSGDEAGACLRS